MIIKKVKFSDGFCREKYRNMTRYETFLQELGIPVTWYVGKETKQLKYRDLTGPEKVKLLQHINISFLLPNSKYKDKIQKIWVDFWEIRQDLKHDFEPDDVDALKGKITLWLENYLEFYQTKDVTPYVHALYAHVPEFLSLYTNLEYFTQQGMEKYNDITSKNFFRLSKHRGVSALEQFFEQGAVSGTSWLCQG